MHHSKSCATCGASGYLWHDRLALVDNPWIQITIMFITKMYYQSLILSRHQISASFVNSDLIVTVNIRHTVNPAPSADIIILNHWAY